MRVNVDKVLERDQKLSELDDRADALQAGASQFETSAAKLKNKYWWKNAKVSATERARCALERITLILFMPNRLDCKQVTLGRGACCHRKLFWLLLLFVLLNDSLCQSLSSPADDYYGGDMRDCPHRCHW